MGLTENQETGDYQFLQLNASETTGTLEDGEKAPIETPGNAPPLQFKQSFEIRADERTRFIAEFAPFRRGSGYLIRPVASGTRVLYGDVEYDGESGDDDEDGDSEGGPNNGGPNNDGGNGGGAPDGN